MENKKENKAGELIRILTILKREGIEVRSIQKTKNVDGRRVSTTIADIIDDANILEKLAQNGVKQDYKIGQLVTGVLGSIKWKRGYKVTPEQEEQVIELGLITREKIEKARRKKEYKELKYIEVIKNVGISNGNTDIDALDQFENMQEEASGSWENMEKESIEEDVSDEDDEEAKYQAVELEDDEFATEERNLEENAEFEETDELAEEEEALDESAELEGIDEVEDVQDEASGSSGNIEKESTEEDVSDEDETDFEEDEEAEYQAIELEGDKFATEEKHLEENAEFEETDELAEEDEVLDESAEFEGIDEVQNVQDEESENSEEQEVFAEFISSQEYEDKAFAELISSEEFEDEFFTDEQEKQDKVLDDDDWEEIKKIERVKRGDTSFLRKMKKFAFGVGILGLCMSIGIPMGRELGRHLVGSIKEETEILMSIKNWDYELLKAQQYGNDYLDMRINPEKLPQNATDEEMLEFREKAWEALEPELKDYVREPKELEEIKMKWKVEEARRIQFLIDEPKVRERYLEQIRRIEEITGRPYEKNLLEKISDRELKETQGTSIYDELKNLNEDDTEEEVVSQEEISSNIENEESVSSKDTSLEDETQKTVPNVEKNESVSSKDTSLEDETQKTVPNVEKNESVSSQDTSSEVESQKTISNTDKKEREDREIGD